VKIFDIWKLLRENEYIFEKKSKAMVVLKWTVIYV